MTKIVMMGTGVSFETNEDDKWTMVDPFDHIKAGDQVYDSHEGKFRDALSGEIGASSIGRLARRPKE